LAIDIGDEILIENTLAIAAVLLDQLTLLHRCRSVLAEALADRAIGAGHGSTARDWVGALCLRLPRQDLGRRPCRER
jgi:hypothetical protein